MRNFFLKNLGNFVCWQTFVSEQDVAADCSQPQNSNVSFLLGQSLQRLLSQNWWLHFSRRVAGHVEVPSVVLAMEVWLITCEGT